MSETLDYLKMFAQFPIALRRFLKHPLTLEESRRIVRERMEHREENFLRIAEKSIYGNPRSPYLALLNRAGCEMQDLRKMVRQKGLEGALRHLREEGVYVTFEELKGRKPIIRNGLTLPVAQQDFDNLFLRRDFTISTSGSTGLGMAVHQNLDLLADETPFRQLMLHAHGVLGAPIVLWSRFLPGASLRGVFMYARMRQPVEHWFAPAGWQDSQYWFKYGLASIYMVLNLRLFGYAVPFPQIVLLDHADVVARHLHKLREKHPAVVLFSGVSTALRVCLTAHDLGIDLSGCVLWVTGEPLSPTKAEQMRQTGARVMSGYGAVEAGMLGYPCANPVDETDVHLQRDALALFTYPYTVAGSGITVPAFNVTTLLDSAPKVLLNTQLDDYGVVEERNCGCELQACGYTPHIRDIRSYSKLVGEGVTLIGNEMIKILEQVLPARFGGSVLDYQLLEQEGERGLTQLYLVISPRVDIPDEQEVLKVLHQALAASSPMADAARAVWQRAQTIRIKRQEPVLTASRKLLPLYIQRQGKI